MPSHRFGKPSLENALGNFLNTKLFQMRVRELRI
tara:strand:+ start:273 stop:374 length:102 start_codon:yes stop_codon:yes gene_type:complete